MAKKTDEKIKSRIKEGRSEKETRGRKRKSIAEEIKQKQRKRKTDLDTLVNKSTKGKKTKKKSKSESIAASHENIISQLKKTALGQNISTFHESNADRPQQSFATTKTSAEFSKMASDSYTKMVDKLSKINDVKKLKKILYNRNYRIKQKEYDWRRDKQIISDMRYIRDTTWRRLSRIKDEDKLIESLKELILSTTRRKNKPKSYGDYSDREQVYMGKAIESLQNAVKSWTDGDLKDKMLDVVNELTMDDIKSILEDVSSWWAISEGYYYAIEDFEDFMEGIYRLMETKTEHRLNSTERQDLNRRLMYNDPRLNG